MRIFLYFFMLGGRGGAFSVDSSTIDRFFYSLLLARSEIYPQTEYPLLSHTLDLVSVFVHSPRTVSESEFDE